MELSEAIEISDFGEVCRFCLQRNVELHSLFSSCESDANGRNCFNTASQSPVTGDYLAVKIKELTGLDVCYDAYFFNCI